MKEILLDTLLDCGKLTIFLFLTYLIMELLEHKSKDQLNKTVQKAGRVGPLLGGIFGIIPQCGFSTAASNLYAGRMITAGTLLAIYLSTSDEMLPIMISNAVEPLTIVKILGLKAAIAVITGFIIDIAAHVLFHKKDLSVDIHQVCEEEHCHCEDGPLISAIKHTLKVLLYIFAISLFLNTVIGLLGEQTLAGFFTTIPVIGHLAAAIVGLIPNCASSVVITELYLDGIISFGATMSGLLVNAGVGLLVLFRMNRHWKENIIILGLLFTSGVLWGMILEVFSIAL